MNLLNESNNIHIKVLDQYDIFKEIGTFIHQVCINLIKSNINDIYNLTKDFHKGSPLGSISLSF